MKTIVDCENKEYSPDLLNPAEPEFKKEAPGPNDAAGLNTGTLPSGAEPIGAKTVDVAASAPKAGTKLAVFTQDWNVAEEPAGAVKVPPKPPDRLSGPSGPSV